VRVRIKVKVNLTGTFLVAKYFLPLLKKTPWTSTANIASLTGQTGHSITSVAYCAAKADVIRLTRRLATELTLGASSVGLVLLRRTWLRTYWTRLKSVNV